MELVQGLQVTGAWVSRLTAESGVAQLKDSAACFKFDGATPKVMKGVSPSFTGVVSWSPVSTVAG